jgi:hypothetical protein
VHAGGADEHADVSVQQLQQHVHPGPVDALPAPTAARERAHDRRQVSGGMIGFIRK